MIPAIIIARGGSKRLPRKNVKLFCGRPLVEWSIIQAKNSHEVSEVWLSSDDEEIKDIGYQAGAKIIHEEPFIGPGDRPPGGHAVVKALKIMQNTGMNIDAFINILATGVMWMPDDFDKAIRFFHEVQANFVSPKHNPRECYLHKKLPDGTAQRVLFSKNGDYYVGGEQWVIGNTDMYLQGYDGLPTTDKGLDAAMTLNPEIGMSISHIYPIEWWQQYDIDDEKDFEMCEIFMRKYILEPLGDDCYERYGGRI